MLKKLKALFGAQDMTVGSPFKCLLKFAVPLLIGNIAQLLYTTVDAMVVGKYVGDDALAAIGVSAPIQNLFLVLFMAIGSGVTVLVSQYFGAKDYKNLSTSIGNSITIIAVVSILLTAIATPLTGNMLKLISTPDGYFEMARKYMMILFLGSAGNGFFNILSGVLRGLGESMFPLLILLFTVVLNIVLDLLFVAVLGMKVEGAAWATIIAQTLSAAICLVKVAKLKGIVNISRSTMRIDRKITSQMLRLGIPSGISMAVMFLGSILVQSIVNKIDAVAAISVTATITATMRVDGFAILPSQTFGMVASTFTGQNVGAGNLDRVRKGSKLVFLMCLVFTLLMVASMLLFGEYMLGLFTDTPDVIEMGMNFIYILIPAYILMVVNQSLSGVMRGAGDAIAPMWISMGVNVALRVPLAFLMTHLSKSPEWPAGNPDAIYYSMIIAMAVGAVVTVVYFRMGKWKNKAIARRKVEGDEAPNPA